MSEHPPINCEQVLKYLFAYLDGELDADQLLEISVHLDACRSCFSRAEFERRLKGHLRELAQENVPADFEQRVRELTNQLRSR
jgi:anti-sigma factor (TIGR02949 family)